MNSINQHSNGLDKGNGPVAANVVPIQTDDVLKQADEPIALSNRNGAAKDDLVIPTIDPSIIWNFSVAGTKAARDSLLESAEQFWRAANRTPFIQNNVRDTRVRHAQEALERATAELQAHEHFELIVSSDQLGLGCDWHLRAMLWLAYAFIGVGFLVLNFTLSSYLIGSGILDFAAHPFKAFLFCSLPITAALTLKALTVWMTEPTRRRYAMTIGVIGGILAAIAWAAAFAWLFAPQSAGMLSLPGNDGGIDFDKLIRTALVFTHILGETLCAAALGLWAEKLAYRNARTEARVTSQFEAARAYWREIVAELERLQANERDELDYQHRFESGLAAFKSSVGARFDADILRRQAAATAATANLLSAAPDA